MSAFNRPEILQESPEGAIEPLDRRGTLSTVPEKGMDLSPENKYLYNGNTYPGDAVAFESQSEPFSQYTLADGTTVKVKMIMLDAVRLDAFDPNGNPVYQFQFQQIIGIVAPDSLKRKAE
jgi:hypothetical protein